MRSVQRGKLRTVLTAAVLASVGGIVGCTGKSEPNGFLDPTSVGRFDDKRPLVVPILSHLDVGMEEANSAFQSATEVRPEDLVAHPEDYLISANDLLTITISDLVGPGADQVNTRRVTETGKVSLPLVGQVQAAGYTEAELEREIQQAYKNAGLIQNAQVAVIVTEARGRTFSIYGPGTAHAGQYPMYKGDFRVSDALVASGDVLPFSDEMYVIRNTSPKKRAATQPGAGEAGGAGTAAPGANLEPGANLAPGANLEPGANQPSKPTTTPPPAPPAGGATTAPAAGGGEGRIVIIDGKPVLIEGGQTQPAGQAATSPSATAGQQQQQATSGQGATATTTTSTATTTTTTGGTETAGETMQAPPADQQFEFNKLTSENQRIIRVSLQGLRNGDMKNNIVLHAGDTLFIPGPVVGEYYMEGHVNRPGVYSLNGREITLTQAVASAAMFDQIAIPRRTEIRRRLGPDREVVIGVDLDSVFAGTAPNVYLKPNDEINVGTNLWAPFLAAVRGGFRTSYGFGFLYDRNYAAKANNAGLNGR